MDEIVMNAQEVADFLKIKKSTVYQLVSRRNIPFHKIGGATRFYKSEILDFFKAK